MPVLRGCVLVLVRVAVREMFFITDDDKKQHGAEDKTKYTASTFVGTLIVGTLIRARHFGVVRAAGKKSPRKPESDQKATVQKRPLDSHESS